MQTILPGSYVVWITYDRSNCACRESVNWEAIKLTTLEKLQEWLHLRPDLECSLRMRQPQCTSMPAEIIPLGYWSSFNFWALTMFNTLVILGRSLVCCWTDQSCCIVHYDDYLPHCFSLRGSKRHRRKRVDSKPARELALFFQQKR
jgi:hypothetical protein